jgi:hypothetical protein
MCSHAVTCPTALDHATLLRWALVLPHGLWLRCYHTSHDSRPYSASGVDSSATACPMALDPASLPKGTLVLPRIRGSLWVVGIKKGIAVLGVQRGTRVIEARPCVIEVPARRTGRRYYHDM